jgi:hypothetical protein
MPKVLITGNGFDLHLGLPTRYSDFIRIMKFVNKSDDEDLTFQNLYRNLSEPESFFSQFNSVDFDKDAVNKLKYSLKENDWFNYFSSKPEFENWVDFEKEIERVLITMENGYQLLSKNYFTHSIKLENHCFEDHILNRDKNVEFVLENFGLIFKPKQTYFEIKEEYLIVFKEFITGFHYDQFVDATFQNLQEFMHIINDYFKIFVSPLSFEKSIASLLLDFSSIDYHFTFNYTETFEKLPKKGASRTFHLHGKINSSRIPLVLGINDLSENIENRKNYLPFIKYFQRLHFYTDYHFLTEVEDQKDQNFEFYVFGHSLNESDKQYIDELFNFILNNPNGRKSITVVYHSVHSRFLLLQNLIHIRGNKEIESLMRSQKLVFNRIDDPLLIQSLVKYLPKIERFSI